MNACFDECNRSDAHPLDDINETSNQTDERIYSSCNKQAIKWYRSEIGRTCKIGYELKVTRLNAT